MTWGVPRYITHPVRGFHFHTGLLRRWAPHFAKLLVGVPTSRNARRSDLGSRNFQKI
jgi:hypothetical protein